MDRLEVARFSSLPEAELAVGLLRRHDIDARVTDREMANSAPHLQIALGGVRITAPDFQIVQARDIIARAQKGEFGDPVDTGESEEWMADHTPGRVGELDEAEVHGALGASMLKTLGKVALVVMLLTPIAGCVLMFATASGPEY